MAPGFRTTSEALSHARLSILTPVTSPRKPIHGPRIVRCSTSEKPVIRPLSTKDSSSSACLQLEEPRQQASSVLNTSPDARVEFAMKIDPVTNLIQCVAQNRQFVWREVKASRVQRHELTLAVRMTRVGEG